jgi:hypothetical protein
MLLVGTVLKLKYERKVIETDDPAIINAVPSCSLVQVPLIGQYWPPTIADTPKVPFPTLDSFPDRHLNPHIKCSIS